MEGLFLPRSVCAAGKLIRGNQAGREGHGGEPKRTFHGMLRERASDFQVMNQMVDEGA
jgi:hypothetical protein